MVQSWLRVYIFVLLGCMREGVENSVVYMVKVRVIYNTTYRNYIKIKSICCNKSVIKMFMGWNMKILILWVRWNVGNSVYCNNCRRICDKVGKKQ